MSMEDRRPRGSLVTRRKHEFFSPVGFVQVIPMRTRDVMTQLRTMADPDVVKGMHRFGVPSGNALGISAPKLRSLAKAIGRNQVVSMQLWRTGILEARALSALVGDPKAVTKRQMVLWAKDFDSWSICDACCGVLFVFTPHANEMAFRWATDKREFVKRAGFVLMAAMAIHQKDLSDREFVPMLKAIREQCSDERGFVRKAVNWALRQIGKRNLHLNKLAIETAGAIRTVDSKAARWIASDALRELRSDAVQRRLRERFHRNASR
jgi:3-methyladenine DNA glycosylase AlkD